MIIYVDSQIRYFRLCLTHVKKGLRNSFLLLPPDPRWVLIFFRLFGNHSTISVIVAFSKVYHKQWKTHFFSRLLFSGFSFFFFNSVHVGFPRWELILYFCTFDKVCLLHVILKVGLIFILMKWILVVGCKSK